MIETNGTESDYNDESGGPAVATYVFGQYADQDVARMVALRLLDRIVPKTPAMVVRPDGDDQVTKVEAHRML